MPAQINQKLQELKDTQNERDDRNIAIDRVGVKALRFPVEVREKQGGSQRTVATTSLAVHLPEHFKGTHIVGILILRPEDVELETILNGRRSKSILKNRGVDTNW